MSLWTNEVFPLLQKTMIDGEFAEIHYQVCVKRPLEDVLEPLHSKILRQVQILEALARDWQEQGKYVMVEHDKIKLANAKAKEAMCQKV